jgi:hypothetical protein
MISIVETRNTEQLVRKVFAECRGTTKEWRRIPDTDLWEYVGLSNGKIYKVSMFCPV